MTIWCTAPAMTPALRLPVPDARFLRGVARLLGALPPPLLDRVGRTIGLAADVLSLRLARTTDRNLALCHYDLPTRARRRLARRALAADGRLLLDVVRSWGSSDPLALGAKLDPESRRLWETPAERGKLLLVPHLGNWEWLNLWLQHQLQDDGGLTALYEPLRDPMLDALVGERRRASGASLLATDRAGLRAFVRRLEAGGTVALLPDQVPPCGARVLAPFYGRPAWTMTLVGRLVRRFQPRVLIATALIERSTAPRYRVIFQPAPTDLAAQDPMSAAHALNGAVERAIALAPEQYQWGYKRFRHATPGGGDCYRG